MNWFLIPLTAMAQSFQITLAGVNYLMTIYWNNSQDAGWQFNLADADTNTPIVAGVPLITGADCLANLGYLGIGGSMYVYTNGEPDEVPTFTNLGIQSNLYFLTSSANG